MNDLAFPSHVSVTDNLLRSSVIQFDFQLLQEFRYLVEASEELLRRHFRTYFQERIQELVSCPPDEFEMAPWRGLYLDLRGDRRDPARLVDGCAADSKVNSQCFAYAYQLIEQASELV